MGTLYIVATPIGNLKDITLRALEVLKAVDYILCEDTRTTGRLLKVYEIEKRLISFGEFTEVTKSQSVINDLLAGKQIALVSDAGTPLVSDPGYKLLRGAIAKNITIESIPGPSAVISALTVSGKPPDKFLFLGYLPKKAGKRKELLERLKNVLANIKMTVVIYEAPHRLLKTLTDLRETFGDFDIVICRELTKLYEEVRREKISDLINHFTKTLPKGEFTLVF